MSRIAFRNFTGGEVTPTLCARYDLKKFGSFLQTCRNFVPNLHGDVERRPGTRFLADLGGEGILIPFQFNTEPSNNYALVFQKGHIRIAQASGLLSREVRSKSGEAGNPYDLDDVYGISFAQVADVLYLAHPKYPLRKIMRKDGTPEPAPVRAGVIVVAGQSNAAGYSPGPGYISVPGQYFFDGEEGQWKTPVADPMFPATTKGGFVPSLVNSLSHGSSSLNTKLYVINVARASSNCATNSFSSDNKDQNWGPNGTLRARALTIVRDALSKIEEKYAVLGTVWLQGEDDSTKMMNGSEEQSDYDATIYQTINWFLDNIGGDFYFSKIGYHSNTNRDSYVDHVNARLVECASLIQKCHLVSEMPVGFRAAGKLQTYWHYTQDAYDDLGADIAQHLAPYAKEILSEWRNKDTAEQPVDPQNFDWTIDTVKINVSLPAPPRPTVSWTRGEVEGNDKNENYTLRYVITAIDGNGVESVASPVGQVKGRAPTDWLVGDHAWISWTLVDGAAEYNIYRESAGYFGFVGTTSNDYFRDDNYEPDTAQTPKKNWDPFANGNNPSSVCFHQQRMWLGGGSKNPATIYASRTGDYESFRKSMPLQDDDALEYVLASGSIDDVKWLVSFDNLLIGTAGAEYKCAASKSSAITPSDCQITVQSYWGSKDLQPLIIGQSIMHCQRSGSHVRDLYYTLESDGYAGNDLSVLSPQLVESSSIVQWCYQQSPSSCVWAVRSDGVLLCLTYMKEQNVFGWSRHVTDGAVKSVAVINGADEDVVMMVVQRTVNGASKYYLERLMPRFKDTTSISDAWYVDAGMYVTPTADENGRRVVCSGLAHLAGKTVSVLSDGSPEKHVVSSSGTFNLDFPLAEGKTALVGLGYVSAMCPLPMETDMQQTGTTLGKRRAYGKCVIRMYRSVGGAYAASKLDGMWDADGWRNVDWYELPFLPENWGEACQPYSGDLEISLPGGQDPDTSIWIKQDKPLPLRVVSIMAEVHFGEV